MILITVSLRDTAAIFQGFHGKISFWCSTALGVTKERQAPSANAHSEMKSSIIIQLSGVTFPEQITGHIPITDCGRARALEFVTFEVGYPEAYSVNLFLKKKGIT